MLPLVNNIHVKQIMFDYYVVIMSGYLTVQRQAVGTLDDQQITEGN